MTPPPPCRLYVIMAREARRAIIFRRGPSQLVQLILWHTNSDEFTAGQWFKGRIYERRCDLSPDARYLIYFAGKHKGPYGTWTAISRPPYLTALALWPKGDSWDGGGLFEDRTRIWLNHPSFQSEMAQGKLAKGIKVRNNGETCRLGEDQPIHFGRLTRDGWIQVQSENCEETTEPWPAVTLIEQRIQTLRERANDPDATKMLEDLENMNKLLEGRIRVTGYHTHRPGLWIKQAGRFAIEYERRHEKFSLVERFALCDGDHRIPIPDASWVDLDQSGRIVFARCGRIYRAVVSDEFQIIESELADFNDSTFEATIAPDWALTW